VSLSRILFTALAASALLETSRIIHDVMLPEEARKSFAARMADRVLPTPQGQAAVHGNVSMTSCCGGVPQDR